MSTIYVDVVGDGDGGQSRSSTSTFSATRTLTSTFSFLTICWVSSPRPRSDTRPAARLAAVGQAAVAALPALRADRVAGAAGALPDVDVQAAANTEAAAAVVGIVEEVPVLVDTAVAVVVSAVALLERGRRVVGTVG